MKKRKLKRWVRITLLFLPGIIMIIQLFFIGSLIGNIKEKINEKTDPIIYVVSYEEFKYGEWFNSKWTIEINI